MTFEHRTLPAYLALCLGLACAFALLPALWIGTTGGRVEARAPGGKAQERIAPGWTRDAAPAPAPGTRVTRMAMESRP
ncbi:MAG: hypothetical protein ABW026_18735 [Microvirga sp.]